MIEPERLPPPPFWRMRYFALSVMARPDRRGIEPGMILSVLHRPTREASGRVRFWGYIEGRSQWLRVVTLEDGETVHNAMFDRDFTP